jgi:hypothetical protein
MFLVSVGLMFVYVRRRAGDWIALASALPILVLGPASEDLLWPFQLGFTASMSAGIGALLALDRRDRLGDRLACVLTVVSLSFSSLGLPFAVGVAIDVAWGDDRRRRAWVAAIPLGLYALWWLGWGRDADNYLSLHNLVTLPSYVLDGLASSLASLTGLSTEAAGLRSPLDWGRALLLGAIALAIWRLRRPGVLWRPLAVVTAITLAFWALAGLNASIFREPYSGRYQYMGAIFLVLIAAELLRGVPLRRSIVVVTVSVAVLAALANVSALHTNWSRDFTGFGRLQRAGLAAVELSRDTVAPEFQLTEQNSGVDYLGYLDAGSYLSAVDAYGSPAYSLDELAASAEDARIAADQVFTAAHGIAVEPAADDTAGACTSVDLAAEPVAVPAEPDGTLLRGQPGTIAQVAVRRYATTLFPVRIGRVRGAQQALVEIPADDSPEPWELGLSGTGSIEICERAGS